MHKTVDMSLWQGRIDQEDSSALRWHQVIQSWDSASDLQQAITLLGFACDEGVRRNQGRVGARKGPVDIRRALANLAFHQENKAVDAGDIECDDGKLEESQELLAQQLTHIFKHNGHPIVLGGGHEMAWGSFQGLANYLYEFDTTRCIGIINFDAHFDLRDPKPVPNSGTPFRQIAQWCEANQRPFHYLALGINQSANTSALFDFATQKKVKWVEDIDCTIDRISQLESTIVKFLSNIDDLYLTICMDVFAAPYAPGVSAPSAVGIEPSVVISLLRRLKSLCADQQVKLRLVDIAELNSDYDVDARTAKLAARLVHEISDILA